jgi:formylglycine-generating enzyme required for sulfatase activity
MAPEQALDAARTDIRSDIYSLGCTLYFLLTGAPPFSGESYYVILKAHESAEAAPLGQQRPDVPAELAAVVEKMLAKEPAHRYSDPVSVATALAPFSGAGALAYAGTKVHSRRRPWHSVSAMLGILAVCAVYLAIRWLTSAPSAFLPPNGGENAPPSQPPPLDCTAANGVSAADVRKAQEAWARFLGGSVEEEDEIAPGVKMKFVLAPPGRFIMGSPQAERDYIRRAFGEPCGAFADGTETPHSVDVPRPFYLGVHDVTQEQYRAVTGQNPSEFQGDHLPVENVSWIDADAFARKLTERAKHSRVYRLPTNVEWEYAARGGRSSSAAFGVEDGSRLSS